MDIRGETIQNGEPTPEHPVDIENKINLTGAIQILNKLKSKVTLVEADKKEYRLPFLMNIEQQAIETVLSELEKKDKVINKMAEMLSKRYCFAPIPEKCNQSACDFDKSKCIPCIIEYFTNKVESRE